MSKPTKQRLALFLDGTWNTEDDSTNVLNAYFSTVEGKIDDKDDVEIIQKRYYDRGVGTSVFDNITGGGFGLGLEKNVREAYNWLVDNYNGEGVDDKNADEIYIFGFSRGAYTARSLVGLIASCGLVRRGAPITITQLWNGYSYISKNRSEDKAWWKENMLAAKNKHLFGRLSSYYYRTPSNSHYNDTEELINIWSRRVNITYLGIYDTVGAMGIHALGIPGLRSKRDKIHNQNPTNIIKNCRHAMAIDEHRGSFRPTPFIHYVKNKEFTKKDDETQIEEKDLYNTIIQQKWFTGAHSNIGGGYANNLLSIAPFEWIMEGANCDNITNLELTDINENDEKRRFKAGSRSDIRDSFAELLGFIYPHLIRAKRTYRVIDRPDIVNSGHTLLTVNEKIHKSVFDIVENQDNYAPPNLISYFKRYPKKVKSKYSKHTLAIDKIKNRKPQSQWPGEMLSYEEDQNNKKGKFMPNLLLIIWSTLAAFGLIKIAQFFWITDFTPPFYLLGILSCFFILVDWNEAKITMKTNFSPKAIRIRVIWNIIYWFRLFAVLALLVGFICLIFNSIGYLRGLTIPFFDTANFWAEFWNNIFDFEYWKNKITALFENQLIHSYLFSISISAFLVFIIHRIKKPFTNTIIKEKHNNINTDNLLPVEKKVHDSKNNFLLVFIISVFLVALFLFITYQNLSPMAYTDSMFNSLLLIFILLFALPYMFEWVGKPMSKSKSGLGSILQVHSASNLAKIKSLFNSWIEEFKRIGFSDEDEEVIDDLVLTTKEKTSEEEPITNKKLLSSTSNVVQEIDKQNAFAWLRIREILRETILRDIIGFVPLYSIIFGFILCVGSIILFGTCDIEGSHNYFELIPYWLALILFTALFDMIENFVHLKLINNHAQRGSKESTVKIGISATFLKNIGFITSSLLSILVVIYLAIKVIIHAGGFKTIIIIILSTLLIFKLVTSFKERKRLEKMRIEKMNKERNMADLVA